MMKERPAPARDKILKAGIERFRTLGYNATTVDQICEDAGVTKGAFFHHFASKEEVALACLDLWEKRSERFDDQAPYRQIEDPVERLYHALDFYTCFFSNESLVRSCLVGTTVQECSETSPRLRKAADACFLKARGRFERLIAEAAAANGRVVDAAALALLWEAGIQGALVLFKASRDPATIRGTLNQIVEYIRIHVSTKEESMV